MNKINFNNLEKVGYLNFLSYNKEKNKSILKKYFDASDSVISEIEDRFSSINFSIYQVNYKKEYKEITDSRKDTYVDTIEHFTLPIIPFVDNEVNSYIEFLYDDLKENNRKDNIFSLLNDSSFLEKELL